MGGPESEPNGVRIIARDHDQSPVEVSVVLPCLNEEASVGACIEKILAVFSEQKIDGEIIVVDNGSTDQSVPIIRSEYPSVRLLSEPERGYGAAVRRGIDSARGTSIIMGDADGTYDFLEIPKFVDLLRQGYDLVMGSRLKGKILPGAMRWSHRRIGNPILSGALKLFFGGDTSDSHCGLRGFTKAAYDKMGLQTTGMEFASEMVIHSLIKELKIAEVPITYYPRRGESKLLGFRDAWRHIRFMLIYSPGYLFLLPGFALFLASLAATVRLAFGPLELPEGHVSVSQGRLFIGEQSVEGLQGSFGLDHGDLHAEIGRGPGSEPFVLLRALAREKKVQGILDLRISGETGDTAHLAQRLSGDLLKDVRLDAQAEGELDKDGLHWQGRIREFAGHFQGFDLVQARAGILGGDAQAMTMDLEFEGYQGRTAAPGGTPPGAVPAAPTANLHLSGSLPFSTTGAARLRCVGSGQLANLKTILDHLLELENASGLLADLKPEGRATMDLTASGSLADPRLDGTLALSNGRLMLRTFPQSVEDVSFTIQFKGREIFLPENDPLMGTFAQGNIGVWGKASWQLGGLSRYDLKASLMDFLLRDVPAGFELQGSLDASLSGDDRNGGVLKGTLDAERAAYRTDISLNDLILNRSLGSTPDLAGLDPDDPLGRIDLDLDLHLRQPWDFDTNLLKIKGRPEGTFKILGTLARPGLKGRMEFLPGGRLTNLLPAGDVVLERSTIDFTDPLVMNPVINLEGRIDVPPYLVTLSINGTLDQLNLVPTSTPSLRQDEVVAILIDPTLAQSIGTTAGPTSQTVLTSGFLGAGQSLLVSLAFANFQETLRKTLGLDRVNASVRTGTAGNLETSLTLGKSLDLLGFRTPIIGTYRRSGEVATLSGQVEWRFGNLILQFGASGSKATGINPTGEIRHTWSPR